MTDKPYESYFKAHDQHRLYYQSWEADSPKGADPKGVMIFVHGLNEHSGRYGNPVRYFSKKGYGLYLFDHRGHGRSDGLRSFVDKFDDYLRDVDEFVKIVAAKEKKRKIFLIGHSMGGQIVLNYMARFPNKLAGFMTSSANVRMAVQVPWLKKQAAMLLAYFYPKFKLGSELDPKWICRDLEVVRAYKKDPLVSKFISLKLAAELVLNQKSILGLAPKITTPALIMHAGADVICAAEGSKEFYEKLGSKKKKLIIYDGFYHELFNENGKERVFKDMEKWMATC